MSCLRFRANPAEDTAAIFPLIVPNIRLSSAVTISAPPYRKICSMLPASTPRSISQLMIMGIRASIATSPTINRGVATACLLN